MSALVVSDMGEGGSRQGASEFTGGRSWLICLASMEEQVELLSFRRKQLVDDPFQFPCMEDFFFYVRPNYGGQLNCVRCPCSRIGSQTLSVLTIWRFLKYPYCPLSDIGVYNVMYVQPWRLYQVAVQVGVIHLMKRHTSCSKFDLAILWRSFSLRVQVPLGRMGRGTLTNPNSALQIGSFGIPSSPTRLNLERIRSLCSLPGKVFLASQCLPGTWCINQRRSEQATWCRP